MGFASLSRPLPPAAGRYAKALHQLATEKNEMEATENAIKNFEAMLAESEDLRNLLSRPLTSRRLIEQALSALMDRAGLPKLAKDFFKIVVRNGRARDIPLILQGFAEQALEARGIAMAQVTSARPLDDAEKKAIAASLTQALSSKGVREVRVKANVDPAELGGLTIQVGSLLYAGTLAARLQRLAQSLKINKAA
jgi:F-type H+-transporting ATPase subunit delta